MGRLTIIDGFRGFFLLFMGLVHFNGVLHTEFARYNHHMLGWVEDAQGFVFISGLVVGLVYGRKFLKAGGGAGAASPVWARLRTIYGYHLFLIALFLVSALILGAAGPDEFEPYRENPVLFSATSMIFVSGSMHMGILPMYIGFLAFTPLAFAMLQRRQDPAFFAIVATAWLAAQTALFGYLFYQAQQALHAVDVPVRFGIYFNLLGWQLLFFIGLYFGFRSADGRLDLDALKQPGYRIAFLVACAGIVLLALYDRSIAWGWFDDSYVEKYHAMNERSILSALYVVNFALDAFAITWLLVAGAEDRAAWVRRLAAGLRWLFGLRWLVFLGQHSLQVYAFHLLIFYGLATAMQGVELSEFWRTVILLASAASLWLAAWGHARWTEATAPRKRPEPAAAKAQVIAGE